MKSLHVLAAALLCASGATLAADATPPPAPASAPGPTAAHDLVTYYFTMTNAKAVFRQIARSKIETDDGPEARAFMEAVADTLEIEGLVDLLAPYAESAVPAEQMQVCQDFIRSPVGRKVLEVSSQYENFEAAAPVLGTMPESRQVLAFFETPCFKQTLEAITSEEASRQTHDYGVNLACDWVRANMPDKLPLAQEQGMCKAP